MLIAQALFLPTILALPTPIQHVDSLQVSLACRSQIDTRVRTNDRHAVSYMSVACWSDLPSFGRAHSQTQSEPPVHAQWKGSWHSRGPPRGYPESLRATLSGSWMPSPGPTVECAWFDRLYICGVHQGGYTKMVGVKIDRATGYMEREDGRAEWGYHHIDMATYERAPFKHIASKFYEVRVWNGKMKPAHWHP